MSGKLPLRCSEVLWIEKHAGNDSDLNSRLSVSPAAHRELITPSFSFLRRPGSEGRVVLFACKFSWIEGLSRGGAFHAGQIGQRDFVGGHSN